MVPELFSYLLISLAFQYFSVKQYIWHHRLLRDRNKIAAAHLFSGLRVTFKLVQLTGAFHLGHPVGGVVNGIRRGSVVYALLFRPVAHGVVNVGYCITAVSAGRVYGRS